MFPKFINKNQFSFDIKDIFIHKQDIYLIKLLEKRVKLTKMYKSKKLNQNMIKLISPLNFQKIPDENKTSSNHIEKKKNQNLNYKNIKIRFNKYQSENNSYINYDKEKNNSLNIKEDLITSKIFNSDNSKNNKNILKIINKDNNMENNFNNNKSFFNS